MKNNFLKKIKQVFGIKSSQKNIYFSLLGFQAKDLELYDIATLHKSSQKKLNNERLEFLGDSILNTVVSEHLFNKFPNEDEGVLSKKRSMIISRKYLNFIGEEIIEDVLIKHNVHKVTKNMYGNCLEAIIGAIYLSEGAGKAKEFIINKVVYNKLKEVFNDVDYKSNLILMCQKEKRKINFKVEESKGPSHLKEYKIGVYIDDKLKSQAVGMSIKKTEQLAAQSFYENYK